MTGDLAPLRTAIIPVTAARQNCTLVWCARTRRGAFIDAGGELPRLTQLAAAHGVTIERLLVTHGHIDHCGGAARFAAQLGVPIEGPHRLDRDLLAQLADQAAALGMAGEPFEPDRWLTDGDQVAVGDLRLDVLHCPGHTPGHVVFHHAPSRLAFVGDVLFRGSIGRTDPPRGNLADLVASITGKLWPLGGDTGFISGHGPMSTFARERQTNPFVADHELA